MQARRLVKKKQKDRVEGAEAGGREEMVRMGAKGARKWQ